MRSTRRKNSRLEQHADDEQRERAGDQGDEVVQAEDRVDIVHDEAADHVHLAVGEVQEAHDGEDQGEAEGDQGVVRGEHDAVDDDLLHVRLPRRALAQ